MKCCSKNCKKMGTGLSPKNRRLDQEAMCEDCYPDMNIWDVNLIKARARSTESVRLLPCKSLSIFAIFYTILRRIGAGTYSEYHLLRRKGSTPEKHWGRSLSAMADIMTPEQRSHCMAQVKSKGMRPEMIIRSLVHGMGYRFQASST